MCSSGGSLEGHQRRTKYSATISQAQAGVPILARRLAEQHTEFQEICVPVLIQFLESAQTLYKRFGCNVFRSSQSNSIGSIVAFIDCTQSARCLPVDTKSSIIGAVVLLCMPLGVEVHVLGGAARFEHESETVSG
jgi:hypothetical protein